MQDQELVGFLIFYLFKFKKYLDDFQVLLISYPEYSSKSSSKFYWTVLHYYLPFY